MFPDSDLDFIGIAVAHDIVQGFPADGKTGILDISWNPGSHIEGKDSLAESK